MLGKPKGRGRVWGKEGLSLMVNTAQRGMCGVRSRCEVKISAGQRPQELGSLREEMAKGFPCFQPIPGCGPHRGKPSLASLRHLLKVPGLAWPVNRKDMASQEARWQLGVFPWWRWRPEMDNRSTLRTLFSGVPEVL